MSESLSLFWEFWGMFMNMPWWFYILFGVPFVGFISLLFIRLLVSIGGSINWNSDKPQALVEVVAMPNQLIQKKGKPPITRYLPDPFVSLTPTEKKLREGFERIKSEKGLNYLSKLESEYKGLRALLDEGRIEDTVLNLERISKLTSDLYKKGLNFLTQILNVAEQLGTSSKDTLIAESEELKSELGRCTPGSTLYSMVTERLASNAKSLSTVKSYSEKIDELFCQVGLCRDSIREIRLGLPELMGNKPKDELDKIMLELRTRVELAQRIQAEYTRQGV